MLVIVVLRRIVIRAHHKEFIIDSQYSLITLVCKQYEIRQLYNVLMYVCDVIPFPLECALTLYVCW